MQLPILSSLSELSPPPRRFLWFSAFNVISWQCIVGPAMILFARKIDMPASYVGFLISFLPFSMILVAFTVPLVTRLGPKRLMSSSWFLRNISVCLVFLMPLAIARYGPRTAWLVLLTATLIFCIMRAIGVGGWFPWLHEVVPEKQRGVYFSTEAAIVQLINVGIILGQGFLLRGDPDINQFLIIYGIGVCAGLISLWWMSRVPGGGAILPQEGEKAGFASYLVALSDRPFRRFVITASICFAATSWFGAAFVLFLRDVMLLSEQYIMVLMSAGSAGVLLTIRYWQRFADFSGSGRAMGKTLMAYSLISLAFLAFDPEDSWARYALWPAVILSTAFGAAFWMAAHRAMLNYTNKSHRICYTNLWILGTSVTLGTTPILAGTFIHWWGLWGFRICFLISGIAGLICAGASVWFVEDGNRPIKRSLSALMDPAIPLRTLARIAWITLGRHESNRSTSIPGNDK